jgi:putative RNA 2'-phosphotransferase
MDRADVRLSKFLARILRHAPEAAGLTLDREGWTGLDGVLAAARSRGLARTFDDLQRVVQTNDKRRFALSKDGRLIRAVQGHSTATVQRDFAAVEPPPVLWHGTAEPRLSAIVIEGLKPGRRHHVHLSPDEATALKVGRRHGAPVLLQVAAGRMWKDGHLFHQAENGVWLTSVVPPAYLQRVR